MATILESGIQSYFSYLDKKLPAAPQNMTLHDRRLRMEQVAAAAFVDGASSVTTQTWYVPVPGREIPIRIYRHGSGGTRPLVLFFHGGGWVSGSLDSHHFLALALAESVDCSVVSVHYRRPPENPFPAPLDDCFEALRWAVSSAEFLQADPRRVALVGDSAGGHLAACCAIRARERGGLLLRSQALLYPMIEPNFTKASCRLFVDGPVLTMSDVKFYWQSLFGELVVDASAIPSHSDLVGLPATYVLTAEIDPLRDEGEAFAKGLTNAGVVVNLRRAKSVPHGFLRATAFSDTARHELALVCEALKSSLQ